jgi:tRNA nucleotidyltransferase (CCA-adding enzyme)
MDKIAHAYKILNRLNASSFEAFIVGGAVRDYLLGLPVMDIDISTQAKPDDIQSLFKKAIPTGKAFGTMTVIEEGYSYEITTYRKDGEYLNHRKPESIAFSKDILEDLKRRDFTINQLRMDAQGQIYDEFNGLEDLRNRVIRTIGNPHERFEEDALRLLRAFRFSTKLGFKIEEKTLKAIQDKAPLIKTISIERVQQELAKMLEYDQILKTFELMVESGFADHLFNLKPGLMHCLKFSEGCKIKRLYLVSQKVALDQSPWKLPSKTLRRLQSLKELDSALSKAFYPRLILEYDLEDFEIIDQIYQDENKPSLMKMYHSLKVDLMLSSKKELAVNGKELDEALALTHKSMINPILDYLIDEVCAKRVKNQKEALITHAKTYKK